MKFLIPNHLKDKGFTLIELAIVLSTITILASVIIPYFAAYKETVKEVVCYDNCERLKSMYEAYLVLKNTNHSEAMFKQYPKEYGEDICLIVVIFVIGVERFNVLSNSIGDSESGSEGDGGNDEPVPFPPVLG